MAVDVMGRSRLKVNDLNPHISCILCGGYFIDATTITQCLHSFCRACIVRYLETSNYCPVCEVLVHKSKPLRCIRSDRILQDIVYKLVPGLFQNEMCRRRELYASQPPEAVEHSRDEEDRGEGMEKRFIYTTDEIFEIMLIYKQHSSKKERSDGEQPTNSASWTRRFLRCPAAIRMSHLKKFIRYKFNIPNHLAIEVEYEEGLMNDDYSLMDVAYIYSWKRNGPLLFNFSVVERPKVPPKSFIAPPPPHLPPSGRKWETAPMREPNRGIFRLHNDPRSSQFGHRKQKNADDTAFRVKRQKTNAKYEKELLRRERLDRRERRALAKETKSKNTERRSPKKPGRKRGRPPGKVPKLSIPLAPEVQKKPEEGVGKTMDVDHGLFEGRLVIAERVMPPVEETGSVEIKKNDAVKKSFDDYEVDSGRGSDTSSIRSPLGVDDDLRSPDGYKSVKGETSSNDPKPYQFGALDLSVWCRKNPRDRSPPKRDPEPFKHRPLTASLLSGPVHPSLKPLPAVLPHISVHKKQEYPLGNFRYHPGSTLTVFNPNPNSSQTKIVIKNLDPRPKYHNPVHQRTS